MANFGYPDNYNNCYASAVFSLLQYVTVYKELLRDTALEEEESMTQG